MEPLKGPGQQGYKLVHDIDHRRWSKRCTPLGVPTVKKIRWNQKKSDYLPIRQNEDW